MLEMKHLMRAKLENLERLAIFLKVEIPNLRDEYAKQLVLSRRILEEINRLSLEVTNEDT
jgi:hypothetical protein